MDRLLNNIFEKKTLQKNKIYTIRMRLFPTIVELDKRQLTAHEEG